MEEKNTNDKSISEKEYKELKARYESFKLYNNKKTIICVGIFTTMLTMMFCLLIIFDTLMNKDILFGIGLSIAISVPFGISATMLFQLELDVLANRLHRKIIIYEVANVQDQVEEDIYENSIKMSYKYLDQYYLQTREQAQKGFFVTVCISIFGAALIGVGILAMFLEKVEPSYITCASGVITEFISAIFFYLYNKTVTSMSKYHNKLVLSQNISIALKVADTLPDSDKTKAKNTIIDELLKDVNSYLTKSDTENKK
jgi:hypothetical protein|nr:MAG TPA: hypothetical protein [Caudoviricetes sp.]